MTPRNKLTYLMNLDSAWNVNMKNELGIEQESQLNRKAGPQRPVGRDLGVAADRRPRVPQPDRLQQAPAVLVPLALRGREARRV
jgi:hypothetical protein